MDGGDGWRVIACAAGPQDKTIINRIMLRFRPIAPKPATEGSSSGGWKPENKNGAVTSVRTKRKYVRVKKNNEYYKRIRKRKSSSSDLEKSAGEDDRNGKLFTLQLLPETTDLTRYFSPAPRGSSSTTSVRKDHEQEKTDLPRFFHLSKQEAGGGDLCGVAVPDRKTAVMITEKSVIETWVTVESVTDTCMDLVGGLGSTDAEKIKNLEKDTCPGFVSDGSNRVVRVNEAYRKMVTVSEENNGQTMLQLPSMSPSVQMTARLVIKDMLLPYLYYPAFTCWVRLQYTWQKEKYSQMVPCDVWKMDCGGFAWRLDVKAALSLAL